MTRIKISDDELLEMKRYFQLEALPGRWMMIENNFDIQIGDIIVDCGAFRGDMSYYFSKKVGDSGKIYAFEPQYLNIEAFRLFLKTLNISNVELYPYAISDKTGIEKLFLTNSVSTGTIIRNFYKIKTRECIYVNTIKLDDLKIKKINFLWSNIEGAELKMLKGGEKTIRRSKCDLCISTHNIINGYRTTEDVVKLLKSWGYTTNDDDLKKNLNEKIVIGRIND